LAGGRPASTFHAPPDALFRQVTPDDAEQIAKQQLDSQARWLLQNRQRAVFVCRFGVFSFD
jgi:hypothetical protein